MNPSLKPLNVVVGQMTSTEDVESNVQQIRDRLKDIKSPESTDLICFPENSLFMRIQKENKEFGFNLSEDVFAELAEYCRSHSVDIFLGSIPLIETEGITNSTIWISRKGTVEPAYQKIHLFDVEIEGKAAIKESDFFKAGQQIRTIEIEGWKIGLSICYDLRFSELYYQYALKNCDLLMVPSAFTVPTGEAHWHVLLRARAIESQAFVIAAAQGGDHRHSSGKVRSTFGHSLIIDPWGNVLEEATEKHLTLQTRLQPSSLNQMRQQIPMVDHRRLKL